jgi:hypothetical protein
MVVAAARDAGAQGVDLTLFLGRAFPIYEEELVLRAGSPSIPGVDVDVIGSPELRTDGGPVFGGALAFEFGVFAIEGRLDATNVGFDFTGAEYRLEGQTSPFNGVTGTFIADEGRFDFDRISLLSLNARLRSPGAVGIVVSGGFTLLPDLTITGTVPVSAAVSGIPFPVIEADLGLRLTPDESAHRLGVNAGGGLRIGGRVALMAEARVFYFGEYELRFVPEGGTDLLDDLFVAVPPVRFRPVFVNAQAGLVFRF